MRQLPDIATFTSALLAAGLCASFYAAPLGSQASAPMNPWTAAMAEHLWNRAGFGASSAEIEAWVKLGQARVVESLIARPRDAAPAFDWKRPALRNIEIPSTRKGDPARDSGNLARALPDRFEGLTRLEGMYEYSAWWFERMLRSEDPLRDRMTLFWHGHFATSVREVTDFYGMIEQNIFLRAHALESFEDLLRGIARDRVMLAYLNNDVNRRGYANENWARELMELFSLGDGNFTETDVKEVARAFTGWTHRNGEFCFDRSLHDSGQKTVLGVSGKLDGDDVIDIILEQEACGRWIAGEILRYLEGRPPSQARVQHYGKLLQGNDYHIGNMLRELFLDPEFYSESTIGKRVSSPIDYLVGCARRTGARPPGLFFVAGGQILGQRIFMPPSVNGWEGGMTWINTASVLQRSSLAGVLLGQFSIENLIEGNVIPSATIEGGANLRPEGGKKKYDFYSKHVLMLRNAEYAAWDSVVDLAGIIGAQVNADFADKDRDNKRLARLLLNELLAVQPSEASIESIAAKLTELHTLHDVPQGRLFEDTADAEAILRAAAYHVFGLVEAQLN